jgi:hypothetical protein
VFSDGATNPGPYGDSITVMLIDGTVIEVEPGPT